ETKTIKVANFTEMAKRIKENKGDNIRYSIPTETFFDKKQTPSKIADTKNEIIIGDRFEFGNIANNSGKITVGKQNKNEVSNNDELAKQSYNWQKWGIIIGTILAIIAIIVTIMYS